MAERRRRQLALIDEKFSQGVIDCQKLTWEPCIQNKRGILAADFLEHIQKVHNAGYEAQLELKKSSLENNRQRHYFPLIIMETEGTTLLFKLWTHEQHFLGVVMDFGGIGRRRTTNLVAKVHLGHPTDLSKRFEFDAPVVHYNEVEKDEKLHSFKKNLKNEVLPSGKVSSTAYTFGISATIGLDSTRNVPAPVQELQVQVNREIRNRPNRAKK